MKMKQGTGSPTNDGVMIPRPPTQQTVLEASLKLIDFDRDCRWLDSLSQKWSRELRVELSIDNLP
jgi:hypothetical protein